MLDRLEAKGWVQRRKSEEDGRSVLLSIVPEKAERFRSTVFGPLMTRLQGIYDGFDATELARIAEAFNRIAEAQEAASRDLVAPDDTQS